MHLSCSNIDQTPNSIARCCIRICANTSPARGHPRMFSFAWPWVFALAPLPLLIRWLSRKRDSMGNALRVPFYSRIQELQKEGKLKSYGTRTKAFLLLLVWLALLAASARPIWIGDPVPLPQQGRDLLMAVDISQ